MRKLPNLCGLKFNSLTIISVHSKPKSGIKYNCKCDCGNDHIAVGFSIRLGQTKSCGCYGRQVTRDRMYKHGHTKNLSKEYTCWISIKARCYNPKQDNYKYYGERGIRMCDRWKDSFESFISDMGPAPSPKHSIDRIKNDGTTVARWRIKP